MATKTPAKPMGAVLDIMQTSQLAHTIRAASRRVNASPWWRLSLATQEELARLDGVSLATWRRHWERRLARNARQRKARRELR